MSRKLVRKLETESAPTCDSGTTNDSFAQCATVLAPRFLFVKKAPLYVYTMLSDLMLQNKTFLPNVGDHFGSFVVTYDFNNCLF